MSGIFSIRKKVTENNQSIIRGRFSVLKYFDYTRAVSFEATNVRARELKFLPSQKGGFHRT